MLSFWALAVHNHLLACWTAWGVSWAGVASAPRWAARHRYRWAALASGARGWAWPVDAPAPKSHQLGRPIRWGPSPEGSPTRSQIAQTLRRSQIAQTLRERRARVSAAPRSWGVQEETARHGHHRDGNGDGEGSLSDVHGLRGLLSGKRPPPSPFLHRILPSRVWFLGLGDCKIHFLCVCSLESEATLHNLLLACCRLGRADRCW